MNPLQKALWVLVLLAAIATAAAAVGAFLGTRNPIPSLGDVGASVPPEFAGRVWIAQITNPNCPRACLDAQADFKRVELEFGRTSEGIGLAGTKVDDEVAERLHALAGPPTPRPDSGEIVLPDFGVIGDWSLTGEDGRKFGSADLAARIWIADFIFTYCAGPCPLMCEGMRDLVKRLPDNPRLRFVSFSVDPRRDTPEVLREFAKQWEAPERWRFVTGDGVYNLAYDGFKLEARPAEKPQPGAEFIHSTRFTLVDGRGRMRGIYKYDYEEPDSMGPLLKSIERDARALLETPERVVDHVHDTRFYLVDREGKLRGAYPSTERDRLVADARRLNRSPEKLMSVRMLPRLNAALNGTSFILLSLGLAFILSKKVTPHKVCMTSALVTSILFLVSYLAYHFQAGSVKYAGEGLMRTAYFGVLLSHTVLAALVAPLAIVTVVRAWRGRFDRHVAIARWTLPVWMYVSLTGILVFLMLYKLP